ncbi:MAG: hypothetical protein KL863_05255 [Rhizobium sp.]|nr:hypothetical protein [Rhizobium sp.]
MVETKHKEMETQQDENEHEQGETDGSKVESSVSMTKPASAGGTGRSKSLSKIEQKKSTAASAASKIKGTRFHRIQNL